MNRKERFYTGTVLPMIVAGDGFRALDRLLTACGPREVEVREPSEVQFFTEYSFAASVYTDEDRRPFQYRPTNADAPDLVISGRDWLLAIEAKMFHRPNAAALNAQYDRQGVLINYWRGRFGLHDTRVRHVLLLPGVLATVVEAEVRAPIVTRESAAGAYRDIADGYWLSVLDVALSNATRVSRRKIRCGVRTCS